ncbi:transcription initiation protein [Oleiharenicola lentus]|uniref:Transcription initiation protein n=1 Tax=Oleiharenicola lentus TaxID=2508720 RepID=A0A4Q1C3Z9_9BACT|nr:YciI family protein [Oleiharenicola lentus]RXK53124.1 transcription initiation protein [Oleiharenicola lentus]
MSTPSPSFMFIFREPVTASGQAPVETPESFQRWLDWVGRLRAQGQYVGGDPLEPAPGGVLRGKQTVSVTDGPYAEAKEIVGGYMVIRAGSLAEAMTIARECPGLPDGGSVEVRQVMPVME